MTYKYYILNKGNKSVQGVLSEDETTITYHDLTIVNVKNTFSGDDEDVLQKYYESPERVAQKSQLLEAFGQVDITQEYWTAREHATGRKRKAMARNTEN